MLKSLAILILCFVPSDLVARDSVDLAERNHFFDENGRLVFEQLIFWDWSDAEARHNVRAWRLIKSESQIPQPDHAGGYSATWLDGEAMRSVHAKSFRETWTQVGVEGDPELNEREVLPKEKRKELRLPQKRQHDKMSGRGSCSFRIPKHEQPIKEAAMSGNKSSCAALIQKSDAIVLPRFYDGIEYRPINGFSRYWAGDNGDVLSFLMPGNPGRLMDAPKKIKQTLCKKTGYLFMTLSDDYRVKRTVSGHRAVLLAFVGMCPPGMEACHDPDPTRTNNHRWNLRWDTRKNNHADKWKHGTQQVGQHNGVAMFTDAEVLSIKHRLIAGETCKCIAADFDCNWTTISKIRTGDNWGHIAPELHEQFPPSYRSRRFGVDITKLANSAGVSKAAVYERLRRGCSLAEALAPPMINRLPKDDPRRIAAEAAA